MKELRPLRELLDPERETEVKFAAFLDGEPIVITAVLERTVVYYAINDPKEEKFLVRIEAVKARRQDVRHVHLKPVAWHGRPPPPKEAPAPA